jgi:ubiquinone/menaquinone biosynthesis C-methylase UbiE
MVESASLAAPAHPFDALADDYDRSFTHTRLGRWLRAAVWEAMAATFPPGSRVLELGAATGEDAVWLAHRGCNVVATEASGAMLRVARAKIEGAGVSARVSLHQIDWNTDAALPPSDSPYDGLLANFGVLNCIADRRALAARLAPALRPGARAVLVVMNPVCLWEIAWRLAHGEPRGALRRLRRRAVARVVGGPAFAVWYPSPGRLSAELAPMLRCVRVSAVGFALPPSELGDLVERWPRAAAALHGLDRRVARCPLASRLADHYLAVFERAA